MSLNFSLSTCCTPVLELQAYGSTPGLSSAEGQTVGFVPVRQALCRPGYVTIPEAWPFIFQSHVLNLFSGGGGCLLGFRVKVTCLVLIQGLTLSPGWAGAWQPSCHSLQTASILSCITTPSLKWTLFNAGELLIVMWLRCQSSLL